MVASIIDSTQGGEPEVRRWYHQGKTYAWMVQEYQRKYDLRVSPAIFSYRRSARGWERRQRARDRRVDPLGGQGGAPLASHFVLLRLEARSRRFGIDTLRDSDVRDLAAFREQLKADDVVVALRPPHRAGFLARAARAGDSDIVRQPTEAVRSSRRARS